MCLFASGYDGDDWERHIGKRPETPKHVSGFLWFGRERDVAEGETLKVEVGNRRTTLDGGTGRTRMVIEPENESGSN